MLLTRRLLLALVAGAALSTPAFPALARDGGEGEGEGEGDGGDDGGHDDGGHDGDRGKKRNDDELSQDEVLAEREKGRVIPLETALRIANGKVRGRVIDVELTMRAGRPQYRVKIRRGDGVIKTIRLDARTGRVIGFLGI